MSLLAQRDYGEIVSWTGGNRLSSEEIRLSIEEFPVTVVIPPEPFYSEHLDVMPVEVSEWPTWSIVFPLWTIEEGGMSDLSVELFATDKGGALLEVELDGIHVL